MIDHHETPMQRQSIIKSPLIWLLVLVLIVLLFTSLAPLEKTLGINARVVYLHGAWVWASLITIIAAGFTGILALIIRKNGYHPWSRALGRAGLTLWLLNLPYSLYVMQANWNGLFFAEPRWRIPFTFSIVGLLLQAGLSFMKPIWASVTNPLYALALFITMQDLEAVLHPVSPVFSSSSVPIRLFWAVLLVLIVLLAWQVARLFQRLEKA
jgi:hypothetical protein